MPRSKTLKETASLLRDVPPQNAFYFYRSIGAPTGAAARNLSDFVGVLSSIYIASIQFHTGRGGFENVRKLLGEVLLSRAITGLNENKLSGGQLRKRVVEVV